MKLFITNKATIKGEMMKIVITRTNKKKQSFEVAVMDGVTPIHKEVVSGIKDRDEVVWKLADLYGAVDIEIVVAKVMRFTVSQIPNIPILDETEAKEFFESNKDYVYDRMVTVITEALRTKKTVVRLFELSGTGVYLTSDKHTWVFGLQQALQHYIDIEWYEKCTTIHKLIQKI